MCDASLGPNEPMRFVWAMEELEDRQVEIPRDRRLAHGQFPFVSESLVKKPVVL
jgi:hypothetical protein